MAEASESALREFVRLTVKEVAWSCEFLSNVEVRHCRYCNMMVDSYNNRAIVRDRPKMEWPHFEHCPLLAMMRAIGLAPAAPARAG